MWSTSRRYWYTCKPPFMFQVINLGVYSQYMYIYTNYLMLCDVQVYIRIWHLLGHLMIWHYKSIGFTVRGKSSTVFVPNNWPMEQDCYVQMFIRNIPNTCPNCMQHVYLISLLYFPAYCIRPNKIHVIPVYLFPPVPTQSVRHLSFLSHWQEKVG